MASYIDIDYANQSGGSYLSINYPPAAQVPDVAPTISSVTMVTSTLYQWSVSPSEDISGTIAGTNFDTTGPITVTAGGVACTVGAVTATSIAFTLPSAETASSPLRTAGAKDVTVTQGSGSATSTGAITVTAWTPATPGGLTGWWATDDVLVTSGAVERWNDKSGNGRNLTQGTAGSRAAYTASDADLNSQPSASFDGSDDFYAGAAASTYWTTTAKGMFAVIRTDNPVSGTNNTGSAIWNNDQIIGDVGYASMTLTSGGPYAWCYNYDGSADGNSVTVAANTNYTLTYVHGSNVVSIQSGLGTPATAASGTTTNVATNLTIGSYSTTQRAKLKMTEFGTYNAALAQDDRDRLTCYLKVKYGA